MRKRTIRHVDAFTATPLEGNPAAVVDGDGLSDATMQRIALNQKLSETVFLFPPESPENHARLRIFTPGTELPFAGHPTIAASHVLISEGIVSLKPGETLRLETGAGMIPVDVSFGQTPGQPSVYTMTQVAPKFAPATASTDEIASWIGLQPADVVRAENVSTGLFWLIAQIASFEAMLRVEPDFAALQGREISVFCIGAEAEEASIRVRTFAPDKGVFEDPITGSSNGCIAALIARDGLLPVHNGKLNYIAEQGLEMGQPGRVFLRVSGIPDAMSVRVGGHAVTVLRGDLLLPA
jgi:PhzF family phenazine biosynthesis protein